MHFKNILFSSVMAASLAASQLQALPVYGASLNLTEGSWSREESGWKHYGADGNMHTGWIEKSTGWYYLRPFDGVMLTGLQQIDGNYYYLQPAGSGIEGQLKYGWQMLSDGSWYFFNTLHDGSFGSMKTGWQWIDGYCYYFGTGESDLGRLYVSSVTPDGYLVDEEGKWIEANGIPHYEAGKGLPSLDMTSVRSITSGGSRGGSGGSGGSYTGSGNSGHNTASDGSSGNNNSENEDYEHDNSGNDSQNEDNPDQETSLINKQATKLIDLGWAQYAVIAFEDGNLEDYSLSVDGTDITDECTYVDDEGSIVKWQTTVWNPGKLTVIRISDGIEEEIRLGSGSSEVTDAGSSEHTPASILTNGPVSAFDYYLDNYDSDGNIRIEPEKTTFALDGAESDAPDDIPAAYYVEDTLIDNDGKGTIEVKLSLDSAAREAWFDGLTRIKALNPDNNVLNNNLTFTTEKDDSYGNTGIISIDLPQTNLFARGRYQMNLSSSYSGSTMNVPVHLVDSREWIVNLNSLNISPDTGECFAFDIIGEDGSSFGTEILSPIYRVELEKPSGSTVILTEFDEWYEIGSMLHICGTSPDGNVITDEEGVYTVTIYADGYRTMTKQVEIGSAANADTISQAVGYSIDAISSASITVPDYGDDDGSGSLGGAQVNAFLVFDHDLLANALILDETGLSTADSTAVAQLWYDQTPEAVMDDKAETFYDFTHYLNAVRDAKLEDNTYLTFTEYVNTQTGGETSNRPYQIKHVLEDGKLGSTIELSAIVGKDAPVLSGTSGELGEDLKLTSETDTEYISKITGLYLDNSAIPLRADDYITEYSIDRDNGVLTILSTAKRGQAEELQLAAGEHSLLITADGYKEQTVTLSVTKTLEEFELSLADNPEGISGEDAAAYHIGQDVIINAAADDGSELRGDFLDNLTGVQLKDPAGDTTTVLPYGSGSLYSDDSYVKEDYTLTLQKNLFETAGQYTITLTADGYRAKTLTFDILDSISEPGEDEQTISFDKAELVDVNSIFGSYSYYRISFTGAEDQEIEDLLASIKTVTVDDTKYDKAILGLDSDSSDAYYVGQYDSVYGGKYMYLQLKPADGFEDGEHTVTLTFKEATDITFTFEAGSSTGEDPDEGKLDPPEYADVELIKPVFYGNAFYRITFSGMSEADLEEYLESETLRVYVNDYELENAYGVSYIESGQYAIGNNEAYGNAEALCICYDDLNDKDVIRVEAEGYKTLEFSAELTSSAKNTAMEIAEDELMDTAAAADRLPASEEAGNNASTDPEAADDSADNSSDEETADKHAEEDNNDINADDIQDGSDITGGNAGETNVENNCGETNNGNEASDNSSDEDVNGSESESLPSNNKDNVPDSADGELEIAEPSDNSESDDKTDSTVTPDESDVPDDDTDSAMKPDEDNEPLDDSQEADEEISSDTTLSPDGDGSSAALENTVNET